MVSYAMAARFPCVIFSFRRMGRAKRNPSLRCTPCVMGFASLHPSYKKRRGWPGQAGPNGAMSLFLRRRGPRPLRAAQGFEGFGHAEHAEVVEAAADDLDADRETLGVVTA